MTELEQKKLDAIHKVLDNYTSIGGFEQSEIAEELLSALSQFDEPKTEPFEYSICENNDDHGEGYGYLVAIHADESIPTKQAAIDFCAKHGLKIKG